MLLYLPVQCFPVFLSQIEFSIHFFFKLCWFPFPTACYQSQYFALSDIHTLESGISNSKGDIVTYFKGIHQFKPGVAVSDKTSVG